MSVKARALASALSLLTLLSAFRILAAHQVSEIITDDDKIYIPKFVGNASPSSAQNHRTFREELDFIIHTQRAVLNVAPLNDGIPFGRQREPKDLYLAKSGLCYDRSRVIEKILRYKGFNVRHVAIYSTKGDFFPLFALLAPGDYSHAVTEVLTSKGWLVVDSNSDWVSVDTQSHPYSMEMIRSDVGVSTIAWKRPLPNQIYSEPFLYVYGLYSRHGRFYPPYDFIPDVNYSELLENWRQG